MNEDRVLESLFKDTVSLLVVADDTLQPGL